MKTIKWVGFIGALNLVLQTGCAQSPPAPNQGAYQNAPSAEVDAGPAAPTDVSPAAAEVVKLASSGVSEDVVLAYVNDSQAMFELSADQILYLKDLGIAPEVVTAMINRDNSLRTQGVQPGAAPAPAPAPPVPSAPVVEAPLTPTVQSSPPEDVSYFYNDLAPYGSWVVLDGVGWCWQPRTVVTSRSWRPYCDNGHWVYSDCGWFWQSDYSWGWAPFHYGRWQLHPRCGWVWSPDRVWGPAWVTWRVAGDNCGWAPLPPRAVFDGHGGWRFNGVHVGVNFDFGLRADHFTFVAVHDFTGRDLGHRALQATQVRNVYRQTTVINNTTVVNNNIIVNRGIAVDKVSAATHTQIHQASIRDVPAGGRRPSAGGGRNAAQPVVFKHDLPSRPAAVKVEAQRIDSRHPVVQHNELSTLRTVHREAPRSGGQNSTPAPSRNIGGSTRTPSQPAPVVKPTPSRETPINRERPSTKERETQAPIRNTTPAPTPSRGNSINQDRSSPGDRTPSRETQAPIHNTSPTPALTPKPAPSPKPSSAFEPPKQTTPVPTPRPSRTIEPPKVSSERSLPPSRSTPPAASSHHGSSGLVSPGNSDSRNQSPHVYPPKGSSQSSERYSAPRSVERAQPSSPPPASSSRGSESRGNDSGSRKRN